jgi:hypothetical protein
LDIKNILTSIKRHPSIIKYVIAGKKRDEIKTVIKELDKKQNELQYKKEVDNFIACLKKTRYTIAILIQITILA